MDHLKRFRQQIAVRYMLVTLLPGLGMACAYAYFTSIGSEDWISILVASSVLLILAACCAYLLSSMAMKPIKLIWQAVWHISPHKKSVPAPKLETIKLGRELVSSIVLQMYDLVQTSHATSKEGVPANISNGLMDTVPVPLFFVGKDSSITGVNTAACKFIGQEQSSVVGKNLYDILRLSFPNDDTLDSWLASVSESKVIDSKSWERVKMTPDGSKTEKKFDLAASFSKDSSSGNDLVLAMFDRTVSYAEHEKSFDYVAVAVHELRTPLTLLRGYIEVFEEELDDKLTPELKEFMRKMSASAQTLSAFVSNILNVARIDEDQLTLHLREEDWETNLKQIINDLNIRASVRNKALELQIDPNLPKVAIDSIGMYEVINNLVDNAIKYSGQAHKIIIHATLGKDGMVHTEVQDFGSGIPQSAMDGLFTRYYRSHRSKHAVSGSGLGLYLVKSIVTAHGGKVWVKSTEGKGSTFGFSIQQFDAVKSGASNEKGIERQASGWIKNHSLYRR